MKAAVSTSTGRSGLLLACHTLDICCPGDTRRSSWPASHKGVANRNLGSRYRVLAGRAFLLEPDRFRCREGRDKPDLFPNTPQDLFPTGEGRHVVEAFPDGAAGVIRAGKDCVISVFP